MLAGLAACLPDITLVCTADRPEASAQTQRGEAERLCTAVDTSTTPSGVTAAGRTARQCNRRTEAAPAYRAGQRAVSRFNTG